jgi:CRISPR system Cascade subunit CasD
LRSARGRTNTAITLRDYRTGPLFGVAVTGAGLEPLAIALNAPVFTLYLGRKSCPLAAPPGARVVQAENAEAALKSIILPPWRTDARLHSLIVEDEAGEIVHDCAIDRTRWHFAPRRVTARPVTGEATQEETP